MPRRQRHQNRIPSKDRRALRWFVVKGDRDVDRPVPQSGQRLGRLCLSHIDLHAGLSADGVDKQGGACGGERGHPQPRGVPARQVGQAIPGSGQ
ncbi:hypothetical protein DMH04_50400 [Kibdelosporangium aridum]|uniref:Uncharacterized protein n=1 Tax=Kibdelosporangium aridum TaxID=2030 RepID=A0A428YB17_KIBAR|nr:hypothetical protein DMH04_50400 [Kibdelosporangium aridum]